MKLQLALTYIVLQSTNSSKFGMQHLLVNTKPLGKNGKNVTLLQIGASFAAVEPNLVLNGLRKPL